MTDDLISRADAIKEFSCCELTPDGGIDANYVVDFLKELPSAQPNIVRCKECAFADKFYHCNYMTTWNNPDDFCSYGEREGE